MIYTFHCFIFLLSLMPTEETMASLTVAETVPHTKQRFRGKGGVVLCTFFEDL